MPKKRKSRHHASWIWGNREGGLGSLGGGRSSNWLMKEPKRGGGLMSMGKGMNFIDAPPSRKPTRKRKGINTGQVVGTTMRGLGMLARGGGQAVRSGTGAIRAKQAKSRRYVELREKARRYGFKNLSHDEKKEYSSEAMSRGHNIEG